MTKYKEQIARYRAFAKWLEPMPPAPNRTGDDAIAETAWNCFDDAISGRDKLSEVAREVLAEREDEDENNDLTNPGFWDLVEKRLGGE